MAAPPVYLRQLNSEQRSAAMRTEGPLLILAGAGSGKTRTLVYRITHLIRGGRVNPARIVAVTFTNKAAQEMRERVSEFAGDEGKRVTISTFHSLGVRILREYAPKLDIPKKFAIYSAGDQMGALRSACSEISIGDDTFDLKRVMRQISEWKTRGVEPMDAVKHVASEQTRGNRSDDYAVLAADAYGRYEETLRACGAVDFDDLLLLTVKLLREHEDVRQALYKRWHYFMVDEYQDTNGMQLEMTRLLAGPRRNICVVGDDDQSIYAFRGADVGNILDFERHFPGATVIKLEENYRSTQRILAVANAVISGNRHRHAKTLRTSNAVGALLDLYTHETEVAEAEAVAREIQVRRMTRKVRWEEFAVLYRTNPQSRVLEEALRAQNIPYRVVGGTSFFERKEVVDCLAYLRALTAPNDEIALRRIINWPTRGIGRTTVLKLATISRDHNRPFGQVLSDVTADDVGSAPAAAVQEFNSILARARQQLGAAESAAALPPPDGALPPLAAWADAWFRELKIEDTIRSERGNDKTADSRVDNVRDVVGTIARYERRLWSEGAGEDEWEPPNLTEALARLTLQEMDTDEEEKDEMGGVTLMTLHSAKGLEFSDVFIVGLEEGILPHARSLDAQDGDAGYADPLAEERRLLYVGITRAQQRLTLSHCTSRRRGGSAIETLPSRYLDEIPADLIEVRETGASTLSDEESTTLRQNFFSSMKDMLAQ